MIKQLANRNYVKKQKKESTEKGIKLRTLRELKNVPLNVVKDCKFSTKGLKT